MTLIEAAHAVAAHYSDCSLPTQLLALNQLAVGTAFICPICEWLTLCNEPCLCVEA